jgi:hypothetical protein
MSVSASESKDLEGEDEIYRDDTRYDTLKTSLPQSILSYVMAYAVTVQGQMPKNKDRLIDCCVRLAKIRNLGLYI